MKVDLWIETIQAHGHQVWVGLCVLALVFGFALCAGNLRRQILIGLMTVLWGVSQAFYTDFYMSPIARYAWFPYWVALSGVMMVAVFFAETMTNRLSLRFGFVNRKVSKDELIQESVISAAFFISVMLHIGQLASGMYGTGRETDEIYSFSNRLLFSVIVIALVLPGKRGLKALKDRFSEKVFKLVGRRAIRSGSNRSIY